MANLFSSLIPTSFPQSQRRDIPQARPTTARHPHHRRPVPNVAAFNRVSLSWHMAPRPTLTPSPSFHLMPPPRRIPLPPLICSSISTYNVGPSLYRSLPPRFLAPTPTPILHPSFPANGGAAARSPPLLPGSLCRTSPHT
jgi:hypothetical protein